MIVQCWQFYNVLVINRRVVSNGVRHSVNRQYKFNTIYLAQIFLTIV